MAWTSNIERIILKRSDTGMGLTGLTSASAGLIISTICDNEAAPTVYTVAGSTIETIATLGTYAAPTATKCQFKEVDATNHPGLYEFHFADARYAVASSKKLVISVHGATTLLDTDYEINLLAPRSSDLASASDVSTQIQTDMQATPTNFPVNVAGTIKTLDALKTAMETAGGLLKALADALAAGMSSPPGGL